MPLSNRSSNILLTGLVTLALYSGIQTYKHGKLAESYANNPITKQYESIDKEYKKTLYQLNKNITYSDISNLEALKENADTMKSKLEELAKQKDELAPSASELSTKDMNESFKSFGYGFLSFFSSLGFIAGIGRKIYLGLERKRLAAQPV